MWLFPVLPVRTIQHDSSTGRVCHGIDQETSPHCSGRVIRCYRSPGGCGLITINGIIVIDQCVQCN